jgi:stress response protein YsnF
VPVPRPPETAAAGQPNAPAVTLSHEQLRVGAHWVVAGHVRLRRRIVSETRTVEVTVRREEMVVETDAAVSPDGVIAGLGLDGEPSAAPEPGQPPMVFVLREEIPEVVTRIRPYEQVTVHIDIANSLTQVSDSVSTEVADLVVEPPAGELSDARGDDGRALA